jgi:hypothetical protein
MRIDLADVYMSLVYLNTHFLDKILFHVFTDFSCSLHYFYLRLAIMEGLVAEVLL